VIPGKAVLELIGISPTGMFAAVVGIGIKLDSALDNFGIGSDAVPGRGTGPLSLDEFGAGIRIEPSATLSDGAGVAASDGLDRADAPLGELPQVPVAAG
jgi:hypothetical protein